MNGKVLPLIVRLVGLVFIASAVAKAIAPAPYLSVVRGFSMTEAASAIAVVLIGFEALLGVALLVKPDSRTTVYAGMALLMGFLILIPIAQATGAMTQDCGCFGGIVRMHPLLAMVRNLVLLAGLFWAPVKSFKDSKWSSWQVCAVALLGIVGGIGLSAMVAKPARELHALAQASASGPGLVVAAIVHQDCKHCQQLVPSLPKRVGTAKGDAEVVLWAMDEPTAWLGVARRDVQVMDIRHEMGSFLVPTPTLVLIRDGRIQGSYTAAALLRANQ